MFLNKSSFNSNFSNSPSETDSQTVLAFGIGRVSFSWRVCGYAAKSNRDAVDRTFACWF